MTHWQREGSGGFGRADQHVVTFLRNFAPGLLFFTTRDRGTDTSLEIKEGMRRPGSMRHDPAPSVCQSHYI